MFIMFKLTIISDLNKAGLFTFICIISCMRQDKARADLNPIKANESQLASVDVSLKPDLRRRFPNLRGVGKVKGKKKKAAACI